jgi:hypothetical protein
MVYTMMGRTSIAGRTPNALALILGLVIAVGVGSAAQARSSDKTAELFRVAGIDRCFDDMAEMVRSGLNELPEFAQKDGFAAAANEAAGEAFSKETLLRKLTERVDGKLSNEDADAVIAFYSEPLGKRMVALETEAGSAKAANEMMAMAKELMAQLKDDPKRAEVLGRLITSLKMNELMTNMVLGMQRATLAAMLAGAGKKVAMADVDKKVEAERATTAKQMEQMTLLSMAYAYRKASAEDLDAYVTFLEGPAGKRLHDVVGPAISDTLVEAAGTFGERVIARAN